MKRSADGSGVMLRHLRYREKLSGQLEPPGVIELVVIGSGVNGTPKSFVINTDHIRRVIFLSDVLCTIHSLFAPGPIRSLERKFQ